MEADALTPAAPSSAAGGLALGVLGAAVAGQLAFVGAPIAWSALTPSIGYTIAALLAPAALALGLWRASPPALLCGVPLGWALPAYALTDNAFAAPLHAVAVLAAGAYLFAASAWLRAARRATPAVDETPEWRSLDGDAVRAVRTDALPMVAGLLVAAPSLAVALWPPVRAQALVGFPGQVGLVQVGLALLGTLIGLAMATDLARDRLPLVGSRARALVLVSLVAITLALYALIGGFLWT